MKKRRLLLHFLFFSILSIFILIICDSKKIKNKEKKPDESKQKASEKKSEAEKKEERKPSLPSENMDFTKFHFSYDTTIGGSNYSYIVEKEGDAYYFIYKDEFSEGLNDMRKQIDKDFLENVKNLPVQYDGTDDESATNEWFEIYLSFEEGFVRAHGSLPPENYEEFREDFFKLLSKNIKTAKENYGLSIYKE